VAGDRRDELYGLPLEEFVAARDALAKELRATGDREAAAEVKRLAKPSAAAWAVNQAVRSQPKAARALWKAGDQLGQVQERLLAGDAGADDLRAAAAAERAALEALVEAARGLLDAGGHPPSETTLARVEETLHAAAVDPHARLDVAAGRATKELRHVGMGGLAAATAPPAAPGTGARRAKRRAADEAAPAEAGRAAEPAPARGRRAKRRPPAAGEAVGEEAAPAKAAPAGAAAAPGDDARTARQAVEAARAAVAAAREALDAARDEADRARVDAERAREEADRARAEAQAARERAEAAARAAEEAAREADRAAATAAAASEREEAAARAAAEAGQRADHAAVSARAAQEREQAARSAREEAARARGR
jgi:hypothetical protein